MVVIVQEPSIPGASTSQNISISKVHQKPYTGALYQSRLASATASAASRSKCTAATPGSAA